MQVNYVYGEREGNLPRQCTQRDSQRRQEARLLLVLSYIFRNKQIFPPTLFPSTAARTTKRTALFSLPFKKRNPWFLVARCIVDEHRVNERKRRELRRGEGERRGCAGRQLITVSKLQSRLMAKLITNGAAFRARSHASVCWRRIGVTRFRVPFYRHAVLDDNTLALEFPGLKIEKLTVAGWT